MIDDRYRESRDDGRCWVQLQMYGDVCEERTIAQVCKIFEGRRRVQAQAVASVYKHLHYHTNDVLIVSK